MQSPKSSRDLLPDISSETVNVIPKGIVHGVPVAPTADGNRIAWHGRETIVSMGIIEDIERSYIKSRCEQAGEDLPRLFDVTAKKMQGMRAERQEVSGNLLRDLLIRELLLWWLEMVNPCLQKHALIYLHHDQIGFTQAF